MRKFVDYCIKLNIHIRIVYYIQVVDPLIISTDKLLKIHEDKEPGTDHGAERAPPLGFQFLVQLVRVRVRLRYVLPASPAGACTAYSVSEFLSHSHELRFIPRFPFLESLHTHPIRTQKEELSAENVIESSNNIDIF